MKKKLKFFLIILFTNLIPKTIKRLLADKSWIENCSNLTISERNLLSDLYEQKIRNSKVSGKTLCFPSHYELLNNGLLRFKLNCLLIEQISRFKKQESNLSVLQARWWQDETNSKKLLLTA